MPPAGRSSSSLRRCRSQSSRGALQCIISGQAAAWRARSRGAALLWGPGSPLQGGVRHTTEEPHSKVQASGADGHSSLPVQSLLAQPPAALPSSNGGSPNSGGPSNRVRRSSPKAQQQRARAMRQQRQDAEDGGASDAEGGGAVSCEEEAGGCHAVWDDEVDLSRPTAVRAQLLEVDPGLNQNLMSSGTTIAQIFNQDMWERHRQTDRYWLYMRRMRYSTVLRRIFRPCLVFACIAAAVGAINTAIPSHWARFSMPLVPHTLLGAALSLLLVFRTNSSYARFTEGRLLWGTLIRCSRDWVRLAASYMGADLRIRAAQYVQVLAFTLKSHLRKGRTRSDPNDPTAFRDDPSQVVKELLFPDEAAEVLAQPNRPFYVICKMTALSREMAGCGAPRHVMLTLERVLSEMLGVIGGCDRILGTPIPLSYTRHTARSLVLFLTTLPLALWPQLGWVSVPSMFFISFIFLGIDEIGVEIEEPFSILPLLPMCKTIVADVEMAMAMAPRL